MKKKRVRKNGQAWPDNFAQWRAALNPQRRTELAARNARAQWGPLKELPKKADDGPWRWPVDIDQYDRSPGLSQIEERMLTSYAEAYRFYRYGRTMDFGAELDRLVRPLNDTFDYTGIKTMLRRYTLFFFLREMETRRRAFWGWTTEEWIDTINARVKARQHAVAIAYLLCSFSDLHQLKGDHVVYSCLARKVFGREHTKRISDRVQGLLSEWGYSGRGTISQVMRTIFECLLFVRSPHLKDITLDDLRTGSAKLPILVSTRLLWRSEIRLCASNRFCSFALRRITTELDLQSSSRSSSVLGSHRVRSG